MKSTNMFCLKCENYNEHFLVLEERIRPLTFQRKILSILTLGLSEVNNKIYYWKCSNCNKISKKTFWQ